MTSIYLQLSIKQEKKFATKEINFLQFFSVCGPKSRFIEALFLKFRFFKCFVSKPVFWSRSRAFISLQCCGAGPFLTGSGSRYFLSPAPAPFHIKIG